MPKITWQDKTFETNSGESLLEALNRNGVNIPSQCRIGACQTCLVRVTEGTPPPGANEGLSASLRQRGYIYSCVCYPQGDLTVTSGF